MRSKCALCPGGRLSRKGHDWVRDAYEACEFSRVPSEKHVAEVVRTFAQQYHLCDSAAICYRSRGDMNVCLDHRPVLVVVVWQGDERVNVSRWASEEALVSSEFELGTLDQHGHAILRRRASFATCSRGLEPPPGFLVARPTSARWGSLS